MGKPQPLAVKKALGLLLPLGPVSAKAMFSGWGFYLDDVIFAIFIWDQLYFRVDEESKARFVKAGGERFLYEGHHGKTVEMPYCTPPKSALTSSAKLLPWAELGLAAAKRVKKKKANGTKSARKRALDF